MTRLSRQFLQQSWLLASLIKRATTALRRSLLLSAPFLKGALFHSKALSHLLSPNGGQHQHQHHLIGQCQRSSSENGRKTYDGSCKSRQQDQVKDRRLRRQSIPIELYRAVAATANCRSSVDQEKERRQGEDVRAQRRLGVKKEQRL